MAVPDWATKLLEVILLTNILLALPLFWLILLDVPDNIFKLDVVALDVYKFDIVALNNIKLDADAFPKDILFNVPEAATRLLIFPLLKNILFALALLITRLLLVADVIIVFKLVIFLTK